VSGNNPLNKEEIIMKALTLYRPRVLENALSDFDRYLDSFFGDNFLNPSDRIFNRAPSVDVRETEKSYVLEAELPGYDEKDITIRLDGNNLTIESKKEEEKNEGSGDNGNYLIRERRYSSFSRSFKLPENSDSEGITASFKNGVLSMEIGKKAEAQTKVIQISKN
jgi:HSP20 family protein